MTHGSLPDGGGGPQTIYIRTKCKKNFKNDNNNKKKKKYDNENKKPKSTQQPFQCEKGV